MIQRILAPHTERAFAPMRVVFGLLFSMHGMQKLFGLFADQMPPMGSQLWFGGIVEFTCGLAIAVGLFTSWAAFLASGQMAVAYFQFHWQLKMGAAFFPIVNKGEMALLYCFAFLYIACRGPGAWSLDAMRSKGAS